MIALRHHAYLPGKQALFGLLGMLGLLAVAACSPVPDPSLGCTSDTQCQGGVCVAGTCVARLDGGPLPGDGGDIHANDAGNDTAFDVAAPTCITTLDCDDAWPDLGDCVVAACVAKRCEVMPLPATATCSTAGACPAPGNCQGGACLPTGAPCDDNNACTADQCNDAGCSHFAFAAGIGCPDDGLPCTDDRCKGGQCSHPLREGRCLVDGICADDGAMPLGVPCRRCEAEAPTTWVTLTTGACDDGDACTLAGQCDALGGCKAEGIDCDDNNPCSDDSCSSDNGCVHLSTNATCTDNDPCTLAGKCYDGVCEPTGKLACDDQNPCTKDACSPGLGCTHAPNAGPCLADTDPCTDDVCLNGVCIAVKSVSVCQIAGTCVPAGAASDANPCLVCAPNNDSASWTVLENVGCDDDDKCTVLDTCLGGSCKGAIVTCDDNSNCTVDSCLPEVGCSFAAVSGGCNDNSACTVDDQCVKGGCAGSPLGPADCIDGNPCTTDSCDDVVGCTHTPNNGKCDDGDPCTKGDFCTSAACVAGQIVCPCEFNSDCDDQNACTIDVCVLGVGCSNKPAAGFKACDDSDACTGADTCAAGTCVGLKIDCNDSNACTADSCASEVGCLSKPMQGIGCDDGTACTKNDLCLDGFCYGQPLICDDANACTVDLCSDATGKCKHPKATNGAPCGADGVTCTLDICSDGACSHSVIAPGFCLIGGACVSGGAQHPAAVCQGCSPQINPLGWSLLFGNPCNDGDACTIDSTCKVGGACSGQPLSCDDGSPCTLDACNPNVIDKQPCSYVATVGLCSDGSACTTGDTCQKGFCVGKPILCDDSDLCTDVGCSDSTGCFWLDAPAGTACESDGHVCTTDVCLNGGCKHLLNAKSCWIGSSCVAENTTAPTKTCSLCAPNVDPFAWTPATGVACDDGNSCTGGDKCAAGSCFGDPALACDDGNPCTSDVCDSKAGCDHVATAGACDDGNPCTKDDSCVAGKCSAGAPLICAQPAGETDCKVATCSPSAGGCTLISSCPALHACIDGLCLTTNLAGGAGPTVVAIDGASQPLRPSLLWQETHSGPLGALPQLWIAAQRSECVVATSTSAQLAAVRLAPGQTAAQAATLSTPSPSGAGPWCATQPVLLTHPTSYDALLLGWLEGGAAGSACALADAGGSLRLGVIGVGGDGVQLGAAAACPSGKVTAIAGRPAIQLTSTAGSGGVPGLSKLVGSLLRPSEGGALVWQGEPVASWGGGLGSAPPTVTMGGWKESPQALRPSMAPWSSGSVALLPTRMAQGTVNLAVLTALRIDAGGVAATNRNVVLSGAAIAGEVSYLGAEAAHDAGAGRLGVLISGLAETATQRRAFLAFARVHPDQAPSANPHIAVQIDLPAGKATPIEAFRIAHLPNADDFFVVWAAPGSAQLTGLRISPTDDVAFATTSLGTLGGSYVFHAGAFAGDSSGGLSELVVDPDSTRYSVAWEGNGKLFLLTAKLPLPTP